jgi:hypothetical protein
MGSMRRRAGVVIACLVGLAATAAPAAAADWSTARLPGGPGELFLLGVDCPTTGFCAAVGTQNLIATSTDPTGGAAAWRTVYAGEGRYEGLGGPVISGRQVQGVSCPSPGLCVAVTTLGQIYTSTAPTGPASAWSVTELKPTGENIHLYGVSCPTESLCVAVSGRRVNTGKIFTSTDPTGGAAAWQETDLGGEFDFRAVSCASPTLCVAAGANGELVASTDPAGGPGAWSTVGAPGGPGILQSIDCVPGVCLTGNTGGNLLAAAEPRSLASWHGANGGASVQVTGSACVSVSACLAVDNNGDVIVSTEPTGARPAWAATNLRPYSDGAEVAGSAVGNALFGASCPSAALCVLVGTRGAILTSTEPFAAAAPKSTAPAKGKGKRGRRRRGPKRPRARIAHLTLRVPAGARSHAGPRRAKLLVRFYAKGPVRRFECRLDRHRFRRCRSPLRRATVRRGVHVISVRAVGSTGRRGPVARKRFYVGRVCRRRSCVTGATEFPKGPGWKFTPKPR